MSSIKAFITRHPVPTSFALTFAISCGGVLLVIGGPRGIPGTPEQFERLLPFVGPAMLAGPSVAGILLTGLVYGRAGFREVLFRLLRWRVGARWYAVAFLTAPLLFTAVLLALSLSSPEFIPGIFASDDKVSLLLFGIAMGLGAGFFEELGWTGFAVPRLKTTFSTACNMNLQQSAVVRAIFKGRELLFGGLGRGVCAYQGAGDRSLYT
jgi:CAAX protease family protein